MDWTPDRHRLDSLTRIVGRRDRRASQPRAQARAWWIGYVNALLVLTLAGGMAAVNYEIITPEALGLIPSGLALLMAAVGGLGLISTGFAYFGISLVLKTIDANLYSLVDIIVSPPPALVSWKSTEALGL